VEVYQSSDIALHQHSFLFRGAFRLVRPPLTNFLGVIEAASIRGTAYLSVRNQDGTLKYFRPQ
jgi:hypothetical protein